MRLHGKRALITGGTSGLGAAIAQAFVDEGASVVCASRRCDKDDPAPGDQRPMVFDHVDVTDRASVRGVFDRLVRRWGGLDIVVACAGVMVDGRLVNLDESDMDAMWRTNVVGTFNTLAVAQPIMASSGGGSIVTLSSTITQVVTVGTGGYRATKAAVEALSQVGAAEGAQFGIRINSIASGFVTAGISLPLIVRTERWERYARRIALRRAGEPHEIASVAVFLASDESSYLSGAVVPINGVLTWP